jgi:catechol 2,3-dioxygenase
MLDPRTRVGAVTLRVADSKKVADFYQRVIGLTRQEGTADQVRLGVDGRALVILRQLPGGRFQRPSPGLYHLALRVPGRTDLAHWLRHYVDHDAPYWQGASDHGVSEALYLSDPEGNGIEIYRDRPNEQWPRDSDGKVQLFTRHLDLQALLSDSPAHDWTQMPSGAEMGHIHLRVAEIESARRFYVDLLGFNLMAELPGSALFVAAGGYHHHLGLNTWESLGAAPAPEDVYGLDAYEIVLPGVQVRDELVSRLAEENVPVETDNGLPRIRDPFGNVAILSVA